ncbi:MAG: ZIP family metal transporter [Candidatus Aenigmarchaeota archaeon]|nr:ZIP family metal transporter [Candidatus Aenigmarchaeota archaeon]
MDISLFLIAFGSVLAASLMSLIGVLSLPFDDKKLRNILIYFVSFSAGALFGDAFFHLIPEAAKTGFTLAVAFPILCGIFVSLVIEKFLHWQHCHHEGCGQYTEHDLSDKKTKKNSRQVQSYAYMNLFGDAVHNTIDGIVIGASYLVSMPVGITTTLAVVFHEIPQEIGDFGILLHGGFSRGRALLVNLLSACASFLGLFAVFFIGPVFEQYLVFLITFAAGNFIYIAGSDLIPQMHHEKYTHTIPMQLLTFVLGLLVMYGFLFLE